jgi:hypothetical protein
VALSDGTRIDLRRVHGPIIVFCSQGDNITPPQQALGWITDLYDSVDDIRAHGQTIVYSVHESVGHLGIFVSGKVAKKEHDEFASNMDFIDLLPPGLYEAVLIPAKDAGGPVGEDVGRYIIRFEARTLDDIRALGGNDLADERRFASVARLSDSLLGLYQAMWSPWVKAFTNEQSAELMRRLHPARMQFEIFSDANPLMRGVAQLADQVRTNRRALGSDHPFRVLEQSMSTQIIAALDAFRDARDSTMERFFLAVYGSPVVQALAGLPAGNEPPRPRPGADEWHATLVAERIADLRRRIAEGGLKEATIRSMLYIGLPRAAVDERGFAVLRRVRQSMPESRQMPLAEFKQLVRDQFFMLLLEPAAALAAIPAMLPDDAAARETSLGLIREVLEARGALEPEVERRLVEIGRLFGMSASEATAQASDPAKARQRRGFQAR